MKVEEVEIKLQIWDTAGQERYRSIAQNFYKNAMGVIIVFDITDQNTFNNIRNWMRQVKNNAGENVCKILVGNKSDIKESRTVKEEDIKELAEDLNNVKYFEVSAKTGENVTEAFMNLAKEIKRTHFKDVKQEVTRPQGTNLRRGEEDEGVSKTCC